MQDLQQTLRNKNMKRVTPRIINKLLKKRGGAGDNPKKQMKAQHTKAAAVTNRWLKAQ